MASYLAMNARSTLERSKSLCAQSKKLRDEAIVTYQRSRDALRTARSLKWEIEQCKLRRAT